MRRSSPSSLAATLGWMSICAAALVAVDGRAQAPVRAPGGQAAVDGQVPAGGAEAFPVGFRASITNNLGSGTFVLNPNNPTFFTTVDLGPSLRLGNVVLAASQMVSMEWTQSDSTTYPLQPILQDTRFTVRYGGLNWEEAGLSFGLSGGYNLPISLVSRQAGSLGGVAGGGRASWTWADAGLSVYGGMNATYNLIVHELANAGASAPVKPFEASNGTTIVPAGQLTRPGEAPHLLAPFGNALIWGGSLGTSWAILDGQVAFAADLTLLQLVRAHVSPDDEFTADAARPGLATTELSIGSLSVSYTPVPWFTVSGGTSSFQPFWTPVVMTDAVAHADNFRVPRFPFWDFISPYNSFSSFFVDTSFTF